MQKYRLYRNSVPGRFTGGMGGGSKETTLLGKKSICLRPLKKENLGVGDALTRRSGFPLNSPGNLGKYVDC